MRGVTPPDLHGTNMIKTHLHIVSKFVFFKNFLKLAIANIAKINLS